MGEAQLQEAMDQQAKFRNDLDFQVRTNNALREMSRQKERELENSQLDANRSEVKMKGIWKAIENHTNAAAHSQPLATAGVSPDFGSVEKSRMNRTSSAMSDTSSLRTPGG